MAAEAISAFLMEHEMQVFLVIFDRKAYQISSRLFEDIAEYIDDHYAEAHTDRGRLLGQPAFGRRLEKTDR